MNKRKRAEIGCGVNTAWAGKQLLLQICAFLIFCSATPSMSAQSVNFEINWEPGQMRLISYEMQVSETENGESNTPYETVREIRLEVLEEQLDGFTIELSLKNPMLQDLRDFTDTLTGMDEPDDLEIRVFVNRFNGEHEVKNAEEIILRMRQDREAIERALAEGEDELKFLFPLIAGNTIQYFQTVSGINEYLQGRLRYILLPFIHNYKTGETIEVRGYRQNPIDMTWEDPYTALFFLEKTETSHHLIHEKTQSDMTDFVEMLEKMELPPDGIGKREKSEAVEAEFSSHSVVQFHAESGWVNEVQAETRIRQHIPGSDSFETIVSLQISVREIRR